MNSKLFIGLLIGIILLVLVGVIGFSYSSSSDSTSPKNLTTYSKEASARPKVEVETTSFKMGQVKSETAAEKAISIKNTGQAPLQITGITSSCDCTSAYLTIDDQKGPKFSMHDKSDWIGEIGVDKSAQMTITYDPRVHPAKGEVSRAVYFKTNDPDKPEVTIEFTAEVI